MKNMVLRSFAMAASSSCWLVRAAGADIKQNSKRSVRLRGGYRKTESGDYIVKRMSEHAVAFVVLTEKRLR